MAWKPICVSWTVTELANGRAVSPVLGPPQLRGDPGTSWSSPDARGWQAHLEQAEGQDALSAPCRLLWDCGEEAPQCPVPWA